MDDRYGPSRPFTLLAGQVDVDVSVCVNCGGGRQPRGYTRRMMWILDLGATTTNHVPWPWVALR